MTSEPSITGGSWLDRRACAERACSALRDNAHDATAAQQVIAFARDSKWEVRKVVAESLTGFPEDIYLKLISTLCADGNTLVRTVAMRAVERHTPASGFSAQSQGVIRKSLDRIENKFGAEAARAALQFGEKFTELHIKKAVHDIKNVLTHFGLDVGAILPLVKDPTIRSRLKRFEKGYQNLDQLVKMMGAYAEDLDLVLQFEDIADIVKRACASAYDQVQKQGRNIGVIDFNVAIPDGLSAPVSMFHFEMVLTNLIKNGIESHAISPKELRPGSISVEAHIESHWLTLTVRDTGKGIAPGDLAKLREFIPGGSSKRRSGSGSGYGLPICRRYIEAHNGTFQIDSQEDSGTTATIRIPSVINSQTSL